MSDELVEKLPDIFVEKEPGFYIVNLGYKPRADKIRDFVPAYVPLPRKFCEFIYEQIKNSKSVEYVRNVITCGRQFFGYLKMYKKEIYLDHYIINKDTSQGMMQHALYTWKFALSTYRLQENVISTYYKWLRRNVEDDVIYIRMVDSLRSKSLLDAISDPTNIFAIPIVEITSLRNTRNVSLVDALAFELLLSTGIRQGEAFQLQARDINLDETCHDIETDMPSLYFRGSVSLHRRSIKIKNASSRRKVYMSMLARELMIRWFRFRGIKPGSSEAIFTSIKNNFVCNFKKIHPTFYIDMIKKYKPHLHAIQESQGQLKGLQDYMSQLDKDDASEVKPESELSQEETIEESFKRRNISGKFRQALSMQKASADEKIGDIVISREYSSLWTHYMRYISGMLIYYRSQNGSRFNLEELRRHLGHSPGSLTALTVYTTNTKYIESDVEWERAFRYTKLGWIEARSTAE